MAKVKKFNMHDFVLKTIEKMICSKEVSEYKVMQYALSYYEKDVLIDDDMIQIEELINPVAEEVESEASAEPVME